MQPRWRRQIYRQLGAGEPPPRRIRKLLGEIDAEYERADRDGASLRRVLELASDLLQRNDELAVLERPARRKGPVARALHRLFNQAPFAAICCDADLRVVAWNPCAQRLLGWASGETQGREVTAFLAPESERAELRSCLASAQAGSSVRVATTLA